MSQRITKIQQLKLCQLWRYCTSFGVIVLASIWLCFLKKSQKKKTIFQQIYVSTWSVLTNPISNFVWWDCKFSLYMWAEAPNKLTCLKYRYCGHWDVLWSWSCEQMKDISWELKIGFIWLRCSVVGTSVIL